MSATFKTLLTSAAYNVLRILLAKANAGLKKLDEKLKKPVPSPLLMQNDTLVLVEFNGRKMKGWFRGATPEGGYAVRLTNGLGLYAFSKVELV